MKVALILVVLLTATVSTMDWNQANDGSCPPWQVKNNTGVCTCDSESLSHIVLCRNNPYELALQECYCMTYGHKVVVGTCQYSCLRGNFRTFYFNITVNSTALINDAMCGELNRQDQMCGSCKSGYAPPVYSYTLSCVNCTTSNWGKYTAVSLLPLTAFFVFVITFRISAFSPKLHGLILFSQILTCPATLRSVSDRFTPMQRHLSHIVISFLGVWNLDFCRLVYSPFCLHPHTNTLQVMALDYLIAVYPLLLIGLSYLLVLLYDHNVGLVVCLCKPFVTLFIRFRRQWNIRSSLVDAFATFLLLSYVKILSVSVDLLLPIPLYDQTGSRLSQLYLFNQGDVAYFSNQHLPYAYLAIFFLFTFTLLPMLLLFLYPCSWFQVCLNHTGCSCQSLHIFMDSFQGHYKNGTNGTRDFRYFSALYLLLRALVYASTVLAFQIFSYAFTTIFLICFVAVLSLAQPYKSYGYTVNDVFFLTATTLLYVSLVSLTFHHARVTEKSLMFFSCVFFIVFISIILFHWIRLHKLVMWFSTKVLQKMRRNKQYLLPLIHGDSNAQQ